MSRWKRIALITIGILMSGGVNAMESKILAKEVVVRAPISAVWHAWTTTEGLSFVSRESDIELRIGGPYEWFLDMVPDEGGRSGAQGSKVLAYLPNEMIAFSWVFPPDVPTLRQAGETTQVVVLFNEEANGLVRVRLSAHGWQDGEDWQRGWDYFDAAWSYVLDALKRELENQVHPDTT